MRYTNIFKFDPKVVPAKASFHASCPMCGTAGRFRLYASLKELRALGIPILRSLPHYFTSCPHCAAIFRLSPDRGWALERGLRVPITLHRTGRIL